MKNFLALVLILFTLIAKAQWTSDSTSNMVIKDGLGTEEVTPLLASTSDGKTYISWFESNGSSYVMKMQLLDAEGNKLWGADGLLISNHPQESALYVYDLAVDHEGNGIVAFQDIRNTNLEPVVYKLDQSGNFIWGNDGIVLHDTLANFELSPSIGILDNDDVIIGWNATISSKKWVAYNRINSNGTQPWNNNKTIKIGNQKFSRPDFVGLDNDNFLMDYIKEIGSFPSVTNYIYVNKFDGDGNALWPSAVEASGYSTTYFDYPKVIPDSSRGMIIAFNAGDPNNATINDAFIQWIDSSGILNYGITGVEISSYTNHHRLLGNISFHADSNQVAVVLKVLDNAQGQAGAYVQKLDLAGHKLWTDNGLEILPLSANNYHEPFAISLTGDGWIITYTEGGVTSQKLKAMKIDLNANILWGNKSLSTVSSNKYDVAVGNFMNDELVVAWEDERIDMGVYAQNISGEGVLGVVPTIVSEINSPGFSIYPTLTHDQLMVEVKETDALPTFELIDLEGKQRQSLTLHQGINQIDLTSLTTGIYICHINDGEKKWSGKICLQ